MKKLVYSMLKTMCKLTPEQEEIIKAVLDNSAKVYKCSNGTLKIFVKRKI